MYLTLNIVCVCVCVSVSGESVPFSLWGAVVPTPSRYILHSYTLDVCMCTVMYKYRPSCFVLFARSRYLLSFRARYSSPKVVY